MPNITLKKLQWIEEQLPVDVISRAMRGGVGYYLDEKLIIILVEAGPSYEHKGISYPFKIWDGCFFPIDKIKQNAVFAKFQYLENHPALKDSLYLPADSEDFAEQVQLVLREIKKRNPLFGIRIKPTASLKKSVGIDRDDKDTSRPRLFADEPVFKKAAAKTSVSSTVKNPKKVKVSKKNENDFLLSMMKRKNKL